MLKKGIQIIKKPEEKEIQTTKEKKIHSEFKVIYKIHEPGEDDSSKDEISFDL